MGGLTWYTKCLKYRSFGRVMLLDQPRNRDRYGGCRSHFPVLRLSDASKDCPSSLELQWLERLDSICESFEADWKKGLNPSPEVYAAQVEPESICGKRIANWYGCNRNAFVDCTFRLSKPWSFRLGMGRRLERN